MKPKGMLLCLSCAVALLSSCASEGMNQEANGAPQTPQEQQTTPPARDGENGDGFVVTKELYTKVFTEIGDLITTLDSVIKEKNYDEWLTYLSDEYVERTGSAGFLQAASSSPLLQNSHVTLKTLKDYFLNVVVPSRAQAALDRLDFIDSAHVKAITIHDGDAIILYLFVRVDDRWVVGIW
jgi:hypothetical protein